MAQEWIKWKAILPLEKLEEVQQGLIMQEILQFEIEDPNEFSNFLETSVYYDYIDEPLKERLLQQTSLICYFPKNAQGMKMQQKAQQTLENMLQKGEYEIQTQEIKEEDWANNWKQYFKPFSVGERLLIKPSWEKAPATENRVILEIDPSSSFGTGSHETTKMCLEALDFYLKPNAVVLDMGCGSGILGVGAMLLGAKEVVAVDVEENAMETARQNAMRNGIAEENFQLYLGNVLEDQVLHQKVSEKEYDLVFANIVANVILAMKDEFFKWLKPDGILITSGIILDRLEEVRHALEKAGFSVVSEKTLGEWACLALAKKK